MIFIKKFVKDQEYIRWICDQLGLRVTKWRGMISTLNKIPYRWSIDTDENRAVEGINLRNDYFKERGFNRVDTDSRDCTVLEMLVSLANRLNFDYVGYPGDEKNGRIFIDFCKNLGIVSAESNENQCYSGDFEDISENIDRWLDGNFEENGEGSPFYTPSEDINLSNLSVWSAALGWLQYGFEG